MRGWRRLGGAAPGIRSLTGDSEWVEAAASLFVKRIPIKAAFDAYSSAAVVVYETIEDTEKDSKGRDISYIKVINLSSEIIANRI